MNDATVSDALFIALLSHLLNAVASLSGSDDGDERNTDTLMIQSLLADAFEALDADGNGLLTVDDFVGTKSFSSTNPKALYVKARPLPLSRQVRIFTSALHCCVCILHSEFILDQGSRQLSLKSGEKTDGVTTVDSDSDLDMEGQRPQGLAKHESM